MVVEFFDGRLPTPCCYFADRLGVSERQGSNQLQRLCIYWWYGLSNSRTFSLFCQLVFSQIQGAGRAIRSGCVHRHRMDRLVPWPFSMWLLEWRKDCAVWFESNTWLGRALHRWWGVQVKGNGLESGRCGVAGDQRLHADLQDKTWDNQHPIQTLCYHRKSISQGCVQAWTLCTCCGKYRSTWNHVRRVESVWRVRPFSGARFMAKWMGDLIYF